MLTAAHKPSSGLFFPFMDGLRGLAVLSVVVHHCFYFNPASRLGVALNCLLNAGRLGVAIFFVMSGFLMGLIVFGEGENFLWRPYAFRRVGKILPPFLFSLLFAALLWTPFRGPAGVASAMLMDITTLANFIKTPGNAMNPLYWSLFVEIHFYVCLPVLYVALRKRTRAADLWVCLALFLVPVSVRGLLYCAGGPSYQHGARGFQTIFPLRLDAFAPGLLLAALYLRFRGSQVAGRWGPRLPWAGVVLLCVAYAFYGSTHYFPGLRNLNCDALFSEAAYVLAEAGTFFLLCLCFAPATSRLRVLGSRHLGFFGLISYELYLLHYPSKLLLLNFFPHSGGRFGIYLLVTLVPMVFSVLLSALVYYRLSAPILARFKSLAKREEGAANARPQSPGSAVVP